MTYELSCNQSAEEKDSRKKKIFALKVVEESEDGIEDSDSQEEDELTVITKEFRKILKKRGKLKRRKSLNKIDPSKEKEKDKDQ